MIVYKTKAVNAGFELQICKIGRNTYARITKGGMVAARFTSAPICVGIRQAVASFMAFDFDGIMSCQSKQAALLALIPTNRPAFSA